MINVHYRNLIIKQAEVFAENRYDGMIPSSKEESTKELVNYIKEILNNKNFQKNPNAFMKDWAVRRGNSEEFRIVEDSAREFFQSVLNQPKS